MDLRHSSVIDKLYKNTVTTFSEDFRIVDNNAESLYNQELEMFEVSENASRLAAIVVLIALAGFLTSGKGVKIVS